MIYLDNAATTLYKPRAVEQAVRRAMYGAAGYARGGYAAADRAGELVYACREQAAALFDVGEPERVIFTLNATHALNIAINALVKTGFPRHCERLRAQCGYAAADGSKYRADCAGYAAVGRRGYGFCAETGAGTRCRPDDTQPRFQRVRQHCAAGRNRGIADGGRRAAHPGCVAVGGRGGD